MLTSLATFIPHWVLYLLLFGVCPGELNLQSPLAPLLVYLLCSEIVTPLATVVTEAVGLRTMLFVR